MATAAMKIASPPIAATRAAPAPSSPRCSGASEWPRCLGATVLVAGLLTFGLTTGPDCRGAVGGAPPYTRPSAVRAAARPSPGAPYRNLAVGLIRDGRLARC